MSPSPVPVLITEAQAAERLGLSRDLLYRIRKASPRHAGTTLPDAPTHIVIGRMALYRPEDLTAWAERLASSGHPARVSRRRGRPTKAEQIARRDLLQAEAA